MKTTIHVYIPGAESVIEKVKYTEVRQRVVELINEWGAKGYELETSNAFTSPSTGAFYLENFQYFLVKED